VQPVKEAAGFAFPDGLKVIGRRFLGLTRATEAPRRLQLGGSRGISLTPLEHSDNDDPRRARASDPADCQPFSRAVDTVAVQEAKAEPTNKPSLPSPGTENCAPAAISPSVSVQLATRLPHSIRPAPTVSHALRDSNRSLVTTDAPSAAVKPPKAKPVLQPSSAADVLSAPEQRKASAKRKRLRKIVLNSSSSSSGSEGESECSSDAAERCERPARTRRKVSARRRAQVPREADKLSGGEPSDSGAAADDADNSGGSCVDSEDAEPAVRSERARQTRARKSDGKPTVADLRRQCAFMSRPEPCT